MKAASRLRDAAHLLGPLYSLCNPFPRLVRKKLYTETLFARSGGLYLFVAKSGKTTISLNLLKILKFILLYLALLRLASFAALTSFVLPWPRLPCIARLCLALPCFALFWGALLRLACYALYTALLCLFFRCPELFFALACATMPSMRCAALLCFALPCPTLYCSALPCSALPCAALPCSSLLLSAAVFFLCAALRRLALTCLSALRCPAVLRCFALDCCLGLD